MSGISVQKSIDMRGKTITTYILYKAVEELKDMKKGEVLEIVTENFEPIENDIKAWCRMSGHSLLKLEKNEKYQRYHVKKGFYEHKPKKLAMVVSEPGLEELLSPLGFALAAALGENEVHIYFQGPAVRVLKKDFKAKLHGINRPFSGFARKGMAKTGHIPPQDKLGQLKELGAYFYICGPSMQHFKVSKDELIFDDVIPAEYLTFMEIMNKADIQFFLQ